MSKKRTVAGAEQRLYDDLQWAGLDWDEGLSDAHPHLSIPSLRAFADASVHFSYRSGKGSIWSISTGRSRSSPTSGEKCEAHAA